MKTNEVRSNNSTAATGKHEYKTHDVCASRINFEIDDEQRLRNVKFSGGCMGNRTGISVLVDGMKVEDVIKRLEGIQCRMGTSCPDQLSKALKKVLANQQAL